MPFAENNSRLDALISPMVHKAGGTPAEAFSIRSVSDWITGASIGDNPEQSITLTSRQVGDELVVFQYFAGSVTPLNEVANWSSIYAASVNGFTNNFRLWRRAATNDANDAFTVPINSVAYGCQMAVFDSPGVLTVDAVNTLVNDSGTFNHIECLAANSAGIVPPIVQFARYAGVRNNVADAGAPTMADVPSPYTQIGKLSLYQNHNLQKSYLFLAWGYDYQESGEAIPDTEILITPTLFYGRAGVVSRYDFV